MALEILELASGIAEIWFWFSLTGSCLMWMVTFGRVWMIDDHPHWAAFIGIMLHVAVIAAVVFFWGGSKGEEQKTATSTKQDSVAAQKAVR
jgi:hypothetical protein